VGTGFGSSDAQAKGWHRTEKCGPVFDNPMPKQRAGIGPKMQTGFGEPMLSKGCHRTQKGRAGLSISPCKQQKPGRNSAFSGVSGAIERRIRFRLKPAAQEPAV
jgi:hypothetical protein